MLKHWYDIPVADTVMIPRQVMPQIEAHDYNALIRFVREREIWVVRRSVMPQLLRHHQSVDWVPSKYQDLTQEHSEIWVANDWFILDGNHRAYADTLNGRQSKIIQVGAPFEPAIKLLFEFPRTRSGET
jgi:hypothetical protein